MLRTSDLDYDLPPGAVATRPASPRDSARLLVVSRSDASLREDARVSDLPRLLRHGDALVVNDTRTLPARIEGRKILEPSRGDGRGVSAEARLEAGDGLGGRVTGLFLEEGAGDEGVDPVDARAGRSAASLRTWRVMLKANGRLREGQRIELRAARSAAHAAPPEGPTSVTLRLLRREGDAWVAGVEGAGESAQAGEVLARLGATPLPPYILAARRTAREDLPDSTDREWYQTVYARSDAAAARSVAAPTAGLHFTPELLARLEEAGVRRERVTLHVGAGTFKPVEAEFVEQHRMHEEWFEAERAAIDRLESARAGGGRVVAVGTTSARALESVTTPMPRGAGPTIAQSTRLLITPGFRFQRIDALLTNFHLPRSTLLAMVGAFLGGADGGGAPASTGGGGELAPEGVRRLLALYRHVLDKGYRFYSYGDAMLILP